MRQQAAQPEEIPMTQKLVKKVNRAATKAADRAARERPGRSKARRTKMGRQRVEQEAVALPSALRAGTKGASVIAMLRSPAGATVAAMMQETGWQAHSVRGFLAGVIRRKLNLDLQSSKIDGQRIYRVGEGCSPDGSARRAGRKAE